MLEDLELCLAEAINNCIQHAYDGACDGRIGLGLHLLPDAVRLTVADCGRPLPPALCRAIDEGQPVPGASVQDPSESDLAALPEGGWGWMLIRATADRIVHSRRRGWTVLVLEKCLERETG